MEQVVELIANPSIVVNSSGEIVFVNQKALDLFEYSKEEIVGKLVEVLVPDSKKEKHVKLRTNWMKHQQISKHRQHMKFSGQTKSGEIKNLEVTLIPATPEYIVVVMVDMHGYQKIIDKLNNLNMKVNDLCIGIENERSTV